MQIVIEIDEEEYQTYINHTEAILDSSIPLVHQDLLMAVINGTPLPKSHGRIVDGDIVLTWLIYKGVIEKLKCGEVASVFEKATIIDADGGDAE